MAEPKMVLELAGHEVAISNPSKVFFPRAGVTKLDMVRYYLAVAPGALGGVRGRPMALKRFVNGAESEPFFQKRAPEKRPDWIGTVELRFPSGRTADEVVVTDEAALAWVINLGCIDLNPHPVRAADLDHPDELRVDLDPVPGVEWPQIRDVAMVARDVLADFGLTGWPKTSGSRGIHIYARIEPRWAFGEVRRAAVAVAREIERRAPGAGHLQVVEGGAPRRLRRLQPERQGPHGRLRVLHPPGPGRPGVGAADLGRGADVRSGRVHHRHHAARFARDRRSVGRHGRGGRVAGRADRAGGPGRGGGPARRAVAAALREAGRRGAPGPAVQAPSAPAAGGQLRWPAGGACCGRGRCCGGVPVATPAPGRPAGRPAGGAAPCR